MRRLVFALVCAAVVCAGATPADACACGVAIEAAVTNERALVIERDGREEIVASFDLAADGGGPAAVVLPVPGEPEVEALEGDPLLYLDTATRPPVDDDEGDTARAPTGGAGGGGVDVLGREELGGYDVTRLAAADPAALDTWLDDNGYTMPDGAEPIFADYVEDGWGYYVAIKLADDSSGRLEPLHITFPTDDVVYPMRLTQLGTDPVNLTLYVLADGPRRVDGLQVAYEGAVDELDPAPPADVAPLLEGSEQLTKFTAAEAAPASFSTDLAIEAGGAVTEDDGGVEWWVWALIAFAVVDTAVVWWLFFGRRRSQ